MLIPASVRSVPSARAPSKEEVWALSASAQRLYRDWERLRPGDPQRPIVHAAYRAADRAWTTALREREEEDRAAAGLPPRAPEPTHHHTLRSGSRAGS